MIIPGLNVFLTDKDAKKEDFDVEAYDFQFSGQAMFANPWPGEPEYGFATMTMGQNVRSDITNWKSKSIFTILATIGGQAVSMLAFCNIIIRGYQIFTYQRSGIKQLYF